MRTNMFHLQARHIVSAGLMAAMLMATSSGCGLVSQISYWMYGNKIPAKCTGLEGKRVAVVCLDSNSLKGPGSEAEAVAKAITTNLGYHVPDIELVRPAEIADWIDSQNHDVVDYRDIGRGVKADVVLAIDLDSFSIHEGQTLLKGRAKVGVRAYDMSKGGGEVIYETLAREISWPETGARHVTESESNFRTVFIHTLAQKIAKDFYAYDKIEDYGGDASYQGD